MSIHHTYVWCLSAYRHRPVDSEAWIYKRALYYIWRQAWTTKLEQRQHHQQSSVVSYFVFFVFYNIQYRNTWFMCVRRMSWAAMYIGVFVACHTFPMTRTNKQIYMLAGLVGKDVCRDDRPRRNCSLRHRLFLMNNGIEASTYYALQYFFTRLFFSESNYSVNGSYHWKLESLISIHT